MSTFAREFMLQEYLWEMPLIHQNQLYKVLYESFFSSSRSLDVRQNEIISKPISVVYSLWSNTVLFVVKPLRELSLDVILPVYRNRGSFILKQSL